MRHAHAVSSMLLVGCAPEQGPAPPPSADIVDAAPESPTVDGRRTACLQPPYAPADDVTTLEDGTLVATQSDRKLWWVTFHPDSEPVDRETLTAAARRLEHQPGLDDLRPASNCREGVETCLVLRAPLCASPLSDLIDRVRRAVRADSRLAEHEVVLHVTLRGRLGPRCEADDPTCGPEPTRHGEAGVYDPQGSREAFTHDSVGRCEHDGDCLVAGCHDQTCQAWELGDDLPYRCAIGIAFLSCRAGDPDCRNRCRTLNNGAGPIADSHCDWERLPRRVFCGCVEGRCAWFRQG